MYIYFFVFENVLDLFYTMFTQLEVQGLLSPPVCTAQMLCPSHSTPSSVIQGSVESAHTENSQQPLTPAAMAASPRGGTRCFSGAQAYLIHISSQIRKMIL